VKSSQQSQKYSDKSWFTFEPKESCTNIEILYPYLLELSLRWQSQRGNWINKFSATISRNYFYDKKDTKAGPKIHPSNHPRKQPEKPESGGRTKELAISYHNKRSSISIKFNMSLGRGTMSRKGLCPFALVIIVKSDRTIKKLFHNFLRSARERK